MDTNFVPPPRGWSVLSVVGGVVTAVAIIVGLEVWSAQFSRNFANPSPPDQHSSILRDRPSPSTLAS
ncbi:MAG: hypothetical protein F6K19_41910 [Cyanothece sp. SIO1E1]|nr:hypothetical protein [Cyanothece sp. SIO1E1]